MEILHLMGVSLDFLGHTRSCNALGAFLHMKMLRALEIRSLYRTQVIQNNSLHLESLTRTLLDHLTEKGIKVE